MTELPRRLDVAVVGAGIAGLTAAWALQDLDTRVFEADDRVGGRIKSFPRGDYYLSVGAHMFPGPESIVGGLAGELGLELRAITGHLLGISYRGTTIIGGRPELYPFRIPLRPAARLGFIRCGLRLRWDARRFDAIVAPRARETPTERRTRILAFKGDQTFRDYLGALDPEVVALLTPIARRMTAEPEEISAGSVISLFAHVFSAGSSTLGYNMTGGPGRLPEALAERLGERVITRARVTKIRRDGDDVVVDYEEAGEPRTVRARSAIVTATAPRAREILVDAPADLRSALGQITYGPKVVAALLTNETTPMPWDDMYSLLAPNRSFTMVFNHANALRASGTPRAPGGALMVYGGARLARDLWNRSDAEITDRFCVDLYEVFPEARGVIAESLVERWEHTVPYAAPGRHRVQRTLERGIDEQIFLAGDYVGHWVQMESAAETALEAAARARQTVTGRRVSEPVTAPAR